MYDIIVLSNGNRVGNFDISTSTTFMDRSILPSISMVMANKLLKDGNTPSDFFFERLEHWKTLHRTDKVDYVAVLNSTYRYLAANVRKDTLLASPFRILYLKDRDRAIYSIDKQLLEKSNTKYAIAEM